MMHLGKFRVSYKIALVAILVLAAVLRFTGLNWDNGYYLHPDERFMVMVTVDTAWPDSVGQYFDSATSPLNPYNTRHGTFVYGTFPMFLTKAVSTLLGKDVYGETHLAGRAISAISDTGTVFLAAWIARRFFGRAAGLLAGFLLACTVLMVQTAHYYTVDSISVFFATASFATVVKGWDRRSFGWFATAGLMIGLAGASKPNYLIALAFLGLPVAEAIRLHGIEGLIPWSDGPGRKFPILPAVALSGLVAFWTFRIAQPYAFTGPSIWNIGLDQRWVDDLSYWRSAQSGLIDIKSSVQWVDRTPVVFILDNLVRWGMGPALGIASLVALALLAIRLIGAKTWPSWWMLGIGGWCVAQIALYGLNIAQAQRYLMPVYPFLVVLGAGFLVELSRRLANISTPLRTHAQHGNGMPSTTPVIPSEVEGSRESVSRDPSTPFGGSATSRARDDAGEAGGSATSRVRDDGDRGRGDTRTKWKFLRFLGPALIGITVVYTLFYAVAFDTLFVRPISRVEASEWIYANIPPGSTLTAEYWDDALPMRLPGEDPLQYQILTLDLYAYEGPGSLKLSKLIGQLNAADYIILSSNRIIGSVPRQPDRYPMASHYYEMLVDGDLGFDLVAEFQQKPELFGISLNDVNAEETLTVYEHPYVRIFRKSSNFDAHRVYDELADALGYGGVNYLPGDPLGDQMLLSPDEQAQIDAHGTWRTKFDPGSLSNRYPVVWWYLAMQLMIVPALPICWLLFRRFPDHGYALAKIFGLVAVTWLAWLLASLHLVEFAPFSIALAWLILLLTGMVLARSHIVDMTRALRQRWRWIAATETIFLAAFALALWLRSLDPAFWRPTGDNQSPFWYAIFNASLRSVTFPAYDPWLSGGKLHLANWGQMPWVMLTRLTGIVPEIAWNLAFAGIFALAAVTLWSTAAALLQRIGRSLAQTG
ncbi:MAG TPA: DUF2298 domain-containing protein, partial [Thermomicrobiales bacterium]|nr:DUF2298 domain-containing protein [Thermomicrobiales bacterium]